MKLVMKLLAAIVLGILLGLFAPDPIFKALITFKALFGQFLIFLIPLIIILMIVAGIANIQSQGGKLVSYSVGYAYLSSICAGFFAYFISIIATQYLALPADAINMAVNESAAQVYFSVKLTPIMDVSTALIFAFLFGIAISKTQSPQLKIIANEGRLLIEYIIAKIFIPLLPFFIMSIFADMAAGAQFIGTMIAFAGILVLAVLLHWIWLVGLFSLACSLTGRNLFSSLKNMIPAYLTALGTMSSAATMPVTLKCSRANHIPQNIIDFTIPLFANIHLAGSTITIVVCTIAVMALTPSIPSPTLGVMIPYILTLGFLMVAAPGVPGGAVMTALGLLASLGFDDNALGLMIAFYLAQDSFGTGCNVVGDAALSMLVARHVKAAPEKQKDQNSLKQANAECVL